MNRIGLKICCLVVSIIIWNLVASTSVVERSTSLPLRVMGLDQDYTIDGSTYPDQVEVVVRISKLQLLAHTYFNRYIGEVRINLAGRGPGPSFSYELTNSDVASDLLVVGVTPSVRLRLHIDNMVERSFAIELVTVGSLPSDLAFLSEPTVFPDSVLVSGPERFFIDDPVIKTVPVDLNRLSGSEEPSVMLNFQHKDLKPSTSSVRAVFEVGLLEDRTMANIPVIPLVDAGLPEVVVSPPVADIMVRGVADSVTALTNSRFLVTVPVGDRPEGVYSLPGQVEHPAWLNFLRLDPAEFQVIVGNPPMDGEGDEDQGEIVDQEVPGE